MGTDRRTALPKPGSGLIPTGRELRARAFNDELQTFTAADALADTVDWIVFASAPTKPKGQWQYVLVSWGKR